jgi:hypothetical protein
MQVSVTSVYSLSLWLSILLFPNLEGLSFITQLRAIGREEIAQARVMA